MGIKHGLLAAGLGLLAGCADVNYSETIAHPAADELTGYWQSVGPQSELVSPDARASLAIMPDGTTFECRQWQRVIAVQGKLIQNPGSSRWKNITEKQDLYGLALRDGELKYAGMTLQRVRALTPECTEALQAVTAAEPAA